MQVQHFMYFTRLCTLLTFWVYTPLLYQNLTSCTKLHHSNRGETSVFTYKTNSSTFYVLALARCRHQQWRNAVSTKQLRRFFQKALKRTVGSAFARVCIEMLVIRAGQVSVRTLFYPTTHNFVRRPSDIHQLFIFHLHRFKYFLTDFLQTLHGYWYLGWVYSLGLQIPFINNRVVVLDRH